MTKAIHSAGVAAGERPYVAKVGSMIIARSDRAMILNDRSTKWPFRCISSLDPPVRAPKDTAAMTRS